MLFMLSSFFEPSCVLCKVVKISLPCLIFTHTVTFSLIFMLTVCNNYHFRLVFGCATGANHLFLAGLLYS